MISDCWLIFFQYRVDDWAQRLTPGDSLPNPATTSAGDIISVIVPKLSRINLTKSIRSQKPDHYRSSQKSHFYRHVQVMEINRHSRWDSWLKIQSY